MRTLADTRGRGTTHFTDSYIAFSDPEFRPISTWTISVATVDASTLITWSLSPANKTYSEAKAWERGGRDGRTAATDTPSLLKPRGVRGVCRTCKKERDHQRYLQRKENAA